MALDLLHQTLKKFKVDQLSQLLNLHRIEQTLWDDVSGKTAVVVNPEDPIVNKTPGKTLSPAPVPEKNEPSLAFYFGLFNAKWMSYKPNPDTQATTTNPEKEESTSEESTDEENNGSENGSSEWEDSEDNFFGEDGKEGERRDSTAMRTKQGLLNLNEFELKPEEKKWYQTCEKYYNQLFPKEAINTDDLVGLDLFDDTVTYLFIFFFYFSPLFPLFFLFTLLFGNNYKKTAYKLLAIKSNSKDSKKENSNITNTGIKTNSTTWSICVIYHNGVHFNFDCLVVEKEN
ncbi:hypothetical protein RFI_03474 [Reticulomyxa filosa]|uniref:Uncharacterized protein n=1 Tax=Reticulomyxa filosa TaxID=46433 RepID=X6P502_RETFI|nr:hypothetical protein RFI_03474 [Reticulomyxa filosa]|eukprot:ETO33625.1 hypothetical protein RFI_03474 [Reticulomyxa filosa]